MSDRLRPDWQDIESVPEGRRVLLWLERGEKGNGEMAIGMVIRTGENIDGYWTWGGPNSGSDIDERPTNWAPLPLTPTGELAD